MNDIFKRSKMLIGEVNLNLLKDSTVAVIGAGGVGGTVLECLARSGVGHLIIVDYDKVDITNINRQILFNYYDVGFSKVEKAKEHLLAINPNIVIDIIDEKVSNNVEEMLKNIHIDFLVDAIDDMNSKVNLVKYCLKNDISFVCSLGMANRLKADMVKMVRLDKTYNCPLAKKFRFLLRKENVDLKKIMCAFSDEIPIIRSETPASMMMVPSSAGLNIASYVIEHLITRGDLNGTERD